MRKTKIGRKLGLVILWIILVSGCGSGDKPTPGGQCDPPCTEGAICVGTVCKKTCAQASDCNVDQVCQERFCEDVLDAVCHTHEKCNNPNNPCQQGVCQAGKCYFENMEPGAPCGESGACYTNGHCDEQGECIGTVVAGVNCDDLDPCTEADVCKNDGKCVGVPLVCNQPDKSAECIDDSTFRSYAQQGQCEVVAEKAECIYSYEDQHCENCQNTCATLCDNVQCEESNGGCNPNGRCVIENMSPICKYDQAPNGTDCSLPKDLPTSKSGTCLNSFCVECRENNDCQEYPNEYEVCFEATCDAPTHSCQYTVKADEVCASQQCDIGQITQARICTVQGDCSSGGDIEDCPTGYVCADNVNCLTNCTNATDCVGSLDCNTTTGECAGKKQDNESCTTNVECINTCIEEICRPTATTYQSCDVGDSADCENGHTCTNVTDNHFCLKNNGQSCQNNDACVNVCVQNICSNLSGTNEPCDETQDCEVNQDCSNQSCKLIQGQSCSMAFQCSSGFCADNVCCDHACDQSCQICDATGHCKMPTDDQACGIITCSDLNLTNLCRIYSDIDSDRCKDFGSCLSITPSDCTTYVDKPATQVCRPVDMGDDCDVEEICDGQGNCPEDVYLSSVECRPANGVCDKPEICTGQSPSCPGDQVHSASIVCRGTQLDWDCDIEEKCDGVNKVCPLDYVHGSSYVCRSAANLVCDITETCDGINKVCPVDEYQNNGGVCSEGHCQQGDCLDDIAPTPNPAQWASLPVETYGGGGTFDYYAEMTAVTASDPNGVQYYFDCDSDSGYSSGWTSSPYYKVLVGRSGQHFRFRVKTRDASPQQNETGWSPEGIAD